MVDKNLNAPTQEWKRKFFAKTTSQGNILITSNTNKEINVSNVISSFSFVEKEIHMKKRNVECFFDTGSELNLVN